MKMEHLTALPLAATPAPRAWRLPDELWIAAAGLGAWALFPDSLGFLTNMLVTCLLVLSLSLVLGQAGIASLGQAALFGAGAYGAGLFALHLSTDPLLGLLAGAAAGALVALFSGAIMLRSKGLTLIMLSIASAQILHEIASKAGSITGGDDGLSGFEVAPILGRFEFDFLGVTGFCYALLALIVAYYLVRKLAASPFGLCCRAIHSDSGRMQALGCHVYGHLLAVFVIGGALAGVAGALSAQTTRVASLNMLDFHLSAAVLVMLILGGTGRLAGALLGTVVYMAIEHVVSTIDPYNWLFAIGVLLVLTTVFLPAGLVELLERGGRLLRQLRRRA